MTPALVLVPPPIPSLGGPLLGPAMLAAAGALVGRPVDVVDVNALWMRRLACGTSLACDERLVGDHAKTEGLRAAGREARRLLAAHLPPPPSVPPFDQDPVLALLYSHEDVLEAARSLATSPEGAEWDAMLPCAPPHLVGVSVLASGQVIPALALSSIARRRWPGVPVVWGGPYVTLLAPQIANDPAFGLLVDGFVAGYAEGTFARMCAGDPLAAPGVFRAGGGVVPDALALDLAPLFRDLSLYGLPRLTLPVQTSRGCAWGGCAFCTHPRVEGAPRELSLGPAARTFALAHALRADVAVKDAYLVPDRMAAVAACAQGRARWSACTRLLPRLGRERLVTCAAAGLRTLEVGLESVHSEILRRAGKPQTTVDLESLLGDAQGLDMHVIVNVMFGFPGERREDALRALEYLEEELPARFAATTFTTERNLLQVQRETPMGRRPGDFGIRILGQWPWASVVSWDAPDWRAELQGRLRGLHDRHSAGPRRPSVRDRGPEARAEP